MYYDAERNGVRLILQSKTKEHVQNWLDEQFAEKCEDDGIQEGDVMEDDAFILSIDEDTDEEVGREKHHLYYEGMRSEYDEHNLNYRGGFI